MEDPENIAVKRFVDIIYDNTSETKIFNDPIHGHIELHPLLVLVIDTPQFQRLRNLKQLGGNYFVYPGASHNRFEHCIGTCHLAGKLAQHLKKIHPDLIDDRDILCVELAGLCHDLGHGPFSHMFDLKFLPKADPSLVWKHEKGSCLMLDYLIEDNNLEKDFEKYGLKLPQDLIFIKEMINGPETEDLVVDSVAQKEDNDGWKYKGRKREKSFLYEIVSNERNKVDVDKWDYFARDCYHLGIRNSFDHLRFMKFLKVLTVEGEPPQICARDKEAFNLYHMFNVRASLHRVAYQHKCKMAVENMICDAMLLANKHITFSGKDGKSLSISETVTDMTAFSQLSDHIFYQILYSSDPHKNMKKARSILTRILKRDLYKIVGQCKPRVGDGPKLKSEVIEKELAHLDPDVTTEDLVVNVKKFDFGMKDQNPCDRFCFYSKKNSNVPYHIRREDISMMLPETFEDCEILVFSKSSEKNEAIKSCLINWCTTKGLKSPITVENFSDSSLTPLKAATKRSNQDNQKYNSAKSLRFE